MFGRMDSNARFRPVPRRVSRPRRCRRAGAARAAVRVIARATIAARGRPGRRAMRHTAGSARADRPSAFPRVRRARAATPRAGAAPSRRRAPSRCARIFARIDGTASTACPPSRPYARPAARRDESATTTARCAPIASRVSAPLTAASGWRGDTANTHSIAPSSNHLKPGIAGGSLVAPIRQVRAPVAQRFPGPAEHFVRETQRHARVERIERADHRQQRVELQHLVADDPQPVLPAARDLPHALRQPRDVQRQPRRFVGQQLAGRRELQPVAAAVEQQRVEARFELARRVRHRRRCLAEPRGRARQAAGGADRVEQRKFVFGQHGHAPVWGCRGSVVDLSWIVRQRRAEVQSRDGAASSGDARHPDECRRASVARCTGSPAARVALPGCLAPCGRFAHRAKPAKPARRAEPPIRSSPPVC